MARRKTALAFLALVPFVASVPPGCAGRAASDADPRLAGSRASDVSYVLSLQSTAPIRVSAELALDGTAEGTTTLQVDERWASVEHPGREIADFAVTDAAGRALTTTHPDDDSWVVLHEPGARLRATWTLFEPAQREFIAGNEFRTRATADLFQMIGIIGLVYPTRFADGSSAGEGTRRIRFEWRGFAEQGLATACSFGVGPGPFLIERPLQAFRHAVFLAGKLRASERDVPGGKLAVVVAGDDWGFTDAEFADCVARIVRIEREFSGDRLPSFVVTLVPQGPRKTEHSFFVGGTGLTGSFALFVNPGLTLAPGSADRRELLHIIAHEHFHTLGRHRGAEQPEELVYWFSEGFTEFYTRRLLFRSGLCTLDDYLRELNETLERLWLNPGRNRTNEEIRPLTWTDHEIADVPRLRGIVLALVLDHELRARSGGRRSLDDFMQALLSEPGPPFTCDSLLALIEQATDADFAARVRQMIVAGADPPLSDDLGAPVLRLGSKEIHPLDPGLDVNATLEHKELRGVLAGSRAWNAGLRDGQVLRTLEFDDQNGRPSRIVAASSNGETIEFDPRGTPVSVPRFEIVQRDEALARTIL